ncbi:hypothetical protein [Chryseobacterium balustinum]|uniref:hypothetical protein n=1 Tax=Chryseobacterium balustinum TaxID=246 RepID=UPI003CE90511
MEKTEKQIRHESLVEFLSNFSQYKSEGKPRFKKQEDSMTHSKLCKIHTNDINGAVMVFVDTLNLYGGSNADVNLYELLQAYLQVPEYREKFNNLVSEAKSFKNKNE